MARVKKAITKRRRHKKILAAAKGYRGAKSRLVRSAKEALMHAGDYAFAGRKQRKRQKRRLWIVQINAALRDQGFTYSEFIKGLNDTKVDLDRKILSEIARTDDKVFKQIVSKTKIQTRQPIKN